MVFICIWQYEVKSEYIEEFERIYSQHGEWARLFRNSDGYIKTDLFKDSKIQNRFITIDYWNSENLFNNFRKKFKSEYEILDKKCDNYTVSESKIGEYFLIGKNS